MTTYGKGNQKQFLIDGSKTPHSVPLWLGATIIVCLDWAI
ncbi:MAG: hypothetical protein RIR11_1686 [Bacteroidota bacterium]|jgi:hypothetical protein